MSKRSDLTSKSVIRHQRFGAGALFILLAGIGGWSAVASISSAVIAPSIVVVESDVKKVQHLEGGIVAEIRVRDGDHVRAGDLLIRLDDTVTRASLGVIDAQLNELTANLDRLVAERDDAASVQFSDELTLSVPKQDVAKTRMGQLKLFAANQLTIAGEKEQLEQRIQQLHEEIRGLKSQQKSRLIQLGYIQDELADLRDLSTRGLVPRTRILALERQAAKLEGEQGKFTADKARAKGRIAELKVQADQVRRERFSDRLKELRSVQADVSELLERRRAALNRLKRGNIYAPRAGFVHNLIIHTIGGVIAPREPLMAIIPERDALELEARVKPTDIHRVYDGQSVIVRFSSLRAAETPELHGFVSRIPAAITENDDTLPPFYTVRISIKTGEFDKLSGQQLKPGMPAEVFIATGERKAITFLLKPFGDALPRVWRGD